MKTSELFYIYLKAAGWEVMIFSFSCVQRLYWLLNGTYSQVSKSRSLEHYGTSAQVMNIHGRFKIDEYLFPAKRSDFLLTHDRFEHPDYILKDHVTLYQVDEKEAIFVEAPEGHELWRSQYSAFFMNAQFRHALKIIILPIESFHRLAAQIGDPPIVTFLSNTARCGSTLLTHMFEHTDQVVAISEPSALNIVTKLTETKGAQVEKIVVSTVRLLCKPTKLKEAGYVLKLTAPGMTEQDKLAAMFPTASHLFMYRNPVKVAQSLYRLSEEMPMVKTIYYFGKGSASRFGMGLALMGMPCDEFKLKCNHYFTMGVTISLICQRKYLMFRESGLDIVAVRYEDIVKNPTAAMKVILRHCKFPEDGAEKCKRALEIDSQAGTPMSTEVIRRHATLNYEGPAKDESDLLCDKFNLPHLDQEYVAPYTITYKAE